MVLGEGIQPQGHSLRDTEAQRAPVGQFLGAGPTGAGISPLAPSWLHGWEKEGWGTIFGVLLQMGEQHRGPQTHPDPQQ